VFIVVPHIYLIKLKYELLSQISEIMLSTCIISPLTLLDYYVSVVSTVLSAISHTLLKPLFNGAATV